MLRIASNVYSSCSSRKFLHRVEQLKIVYVLSIFIRSVDLLWRIGLAIQGSLKPICYQRWNMDALCWTCTTSFI